MNVLPILVTNHTHVIKLQKKLVAIMLVCSYVCTTSTFEVQLQLCWISACDSRKAMYRGIALSFGAGVTCLHEETEGIEDNRS